MSDTEILANKIVKQLEYYFSEVNLAKDKYLKDLITKSEDGWVSLEEMIKFPRLKSLSDDVSVIKTAVENSNSEVIIVGDNGLKRKSEEPIPANVTEISEKYLDQSIYVKGFKSEETIDDIIDYLNKFGGSTINVHMRRLPKEKKFKGSIFAIFTEKDSAEKFLNNEEAKTYKESAMTIMWLNDYQTAKKTEYQNKAAEKEKREKQNAEATKALVAKKMTKGALMEFDGLAKSEDKDTKKVTSELKAWLATILKEVSDVAWVDFFPLTGKSIVRLNKEDSAEKAKETLYNSEFGSEAHDSFKYNEDTVQITVLTEESEKEYWSKILASQENRKKRGDRNGGPARKRRKF